MPIEPFLTNQTITQSAVAAINYQLSKLIDVVFLKMTAERAIRSWTLNLHDRTGQNSKSEKRNSSRYESDRCVDCAPWWEEASPQKIGTLFVSLSCYATRIKVNSNCVIVGFEWFI